MTCYMTCWVKFYSVGIMHMCLIVQSESPTSSGVGEGYRCTLSIPCNILCWVCSAALSILHLVYYDQFLIRHLHHCLAFQSFDHDDFLHRLSPLGGKVLLLVYWWYHIFFILIVAKWTIPSLPLVSLSITTIFPRGTQLLEISCSFFKMFVKFSNLRWF